MFNYSNKAVCVWSIICFTTSLLWLASPFTNVNLQNSIFKSKQMADVSALTPFSLKGEKAHKYLEDSLEGQSLIRAVTVARFGLKQQPDPSGKEGNGYLGVSQEQDLKAWFGTDGVTVSPKVSEKGQEWRMDMRLKAYGYGEQLVPAPPIVSQKVKDNRIEYARTNSELIKQTSDPSSTNSIPQLVEWYENQAGGIEQGFTLNERPERVDMSTHDPLRLVISLAGGLSAKLKDQGRRIELFDKNSQRVLNYNQLSALDATGRELRASMEVAAGGQEISLVVDDVTANYPVTIDPLLWQQQEQLTGGGGFPSDFFGWSVAISGDTAIVGAREDYFKGVHQGGEAYIFVRSHGGWTQQQKLSGGQNDPTHRFGESVAIDGDTAVIGAIGDDNNVIDQGSAYVFVRSNGLWSEQTNLIASDGVTGDQFGKSVAISGNTVIVGSIGNAGGRSSSPGAAYVFARNKSGTWSQQVKLTNQNPATGDYFGWSVAISGDTAIVGALGDSLGKGSVSIFIRTGETWDPKPQQKLEGEVPGDSFGISVGISGETVVVGINNGDTSILSNLLRQQVSVWVRSGGVWAQQAILHAEGGSLPGDAFGTRVAISGNTLVVGAAGKDSSSSGSDEGAAYIFARTGDLWNQQNLLTAKDGATSDGFGGGVAINNGTVVVGSPIHALARGAAYVFLGSPDTDNDGLPDDWEVNGVTIDGVNIDLPAMGAKPKHKDIFVHAEWLQPDPARPNAQFKPDARALKLVTDAFMIANIPNPDGKKGVNLHVDAGPDSIMNPVTGEKWGSRSRTGNTDLPYQPITGSNDVNGDYVWTSIDALKTMHFGPAKRKAVFHYVFFGSTFPGPPEGSSGLNSTSGISRGNPGSDFLVTLAHPAWPLNGKPLGTVIVPADLKSIGTVMQQAGTFMHELGHNLALRHGGFEDSPENKPNYLSVMNYSFQTIGLLNANGQRSIDYSRALLPPLDENTGLDENVGINDPAKHLTVWKCPSPDLTTGLPYYRTFLPSMALDWNLNGIRETGIKPDINCDGAFTTLKGFEDWSALVFSGGAIGDAAGTGVSDLIVTPNDEPVMSVLLAAVPPELIAEEALAPLDNVVIVSPDQGGAPLTVAFDGSDSVAVTGTIVDWAWDFGDGTTGSGAIVDHTYTEVGEYFASLTVTDSSGRVNLVPLLNLVTVTDAPTVVFAPQAGGSLRTINFSTTGNNNIVSWAWDFGDGTTGSGATITHTYKIPGSYSATLTATDSSAQVYVVQKLVTVTDVPLPTVVVAPQVNGSTHTINFSTTGNGNLVNWAWDFGDGTTGSGATVSHTYALAGEYFASLTVTDSNGFTNTTQNSVTITDTSPLPVLHAGDVDPGFNSTVTRYLGHTINVTATQADGKTLVGGEFESFGGCARRGLARVNVNGSCDLTFDPGLVLTDMFNVSQNGEAKFRKNLIVNALLVQPDGKILVGVQGERGWKKGVSKASKGIFRLNPDGTLDASFNANGFIDTYLGSNGFTVFPSVIVQTMALQPDGKILIAGSFTYNNNGNRSDMARLNIDGSLDLSFMVRPTLDSHHDNYRVLALQPDGKIFIGGGAILEGILRPTPIQRINSDGSLDPTFNGKDPTTGAYVSGFDPITTVESIAVLPDGKVVVGGSLYTAGVYTPFARLNADGSRDTFTNAFSFSAMRKNSLALQTDGKIIAAGDFEIGKPAISTDIARLFADGTLDASYQVGSGTLPPPLIDGGFVSAIALQVNGKADIGGNFEYFNGGPAESIMQVNPDGSRDPGFDSNGPGFNNEVTTLVRQPDGKLLVGFLTQSVSKVGTSPRSKLNSTRLGGLGRLNSDGTTDKTFTSPFDDGSIVQYVALQADGKILIEGTFRLIGTTSTAEINFARLNTDGTLDTTFHPPAGFRASFAAVQPDGKTISAEYIDLSSTLLVRLNMDGSRDSSFSVFFPNGVAGVSAFLPDGRMIITGSFFNNKGIAAHIGRLNRDGSFDPTFDPGTGPDDIVRAFILQPDGKVLIGGDFLNYNGIPRNRIARLNVDGSLDTSFVPVNPNTTYNDLTDPRRVGALALQPDGKVFVGSFYRSDTSSAQPNRIFRLNTDGSLDSSFPLGTGIEGGPNNVNAIVLQPDGNIIIGGEFDVVNGAAHLGLARLAVRDIVLTDRIPPTLTVPSPIVTEATNSSGAVVSYLATAIDSVDPNPIVICTPASGSTFAMGATVVSCNATDASGNPSLASTFTILVQDTAPPILKVPSPIITEATSSSGAIVSYLATANDGVDPNPIVICTPASGSTFAIGTTVVSCTATDAKSNASSPSTFNIKVQDTGPPILMVPSPIVTEATNSSGAVVSYLATAIDSLDSNPMVTCTPASGSTFAMGANVVSCNATDASGNASLASTFTILVQDTTPPTFINVPANITFTTSSKIGGAIVTYILPAAIDTVTSFVPIICSPDSGSTFPISTTIVNCNAIDAAGNGSKASFSVTVFQATTSNVPPTAINDTVATTLNIGIVIDVAANDTDADNNLKNSQGLLLAGFDGIVLGSNVTTQGGQLLVCDITTCKPTGAVHYAPKTGFKGIDKFTYQVRDALGALSNIATVNIDVCSPKDHRKRNTHESISKYKESDTVSSPCDNDYKKAEERE